MELSGVFRQPQELRLIGNVAENWKRLKAEYEIFLIAPGLDDVDDARKAMC